MNTEQGIGDQTRFGTPSIEPGIQGPRSEDGFLLRAPRSEALKWDLETEVVSARRLWLEERQAWWIAMSYLETVLALVLRSFPSVLVIGEAEDKLVSRDGLLAMQGRLL
jgi:hypothetical protein